MVGIERAMSDLRPPSPKVIWWKPSKVASLRSGGSFAEAETIQAPNEASGTSSFIAAFMQVYGGLNHSTLSTSFASLADGCG